MTARRLNLIRTLARVGLAAVFLISAYIKAIDLDQTYVAVNAYQELPKPAVEAVAVVLPWVRAGAWCAGAPRSRHPGRRGDRDAVAATFMAGVTQAWVRGLSIDCGCFGGGGDVAADKTSYGTKLLRDTGFMILVVWLIVGPTTWLSLDGWLGRGGGGDGACLSGGGVQT